MAMWRLCLFASYIENFSLVICSNSEFLRAYLKNARNISNIVVSVSLLAIYAAIWFIVKNIQSIV